jgi:hypothetical protein
VQPPSCASGLTIEQRCGAQHATNIPDPIAPEPEGFLGVSVNRDNIHKLTAAVLLLAIPLTVVLTHWSVLAVHIALLSVYAPADSENITQGLQMVMMICSRFVLGISTMISTAHWTRIPISLLGEIESLATNMLVSFSSLTGVSNTLYIDNITGTYRDDFLDRHTRLGSGARLMSQLAV